MVGENSRLCAVALSILLSVLLSACMSTGTGALIDAVSGKGFYGNFCGPDHPAIKGSGGNEIAQLEALPARDELDALCKSHDLCYARNPGPRAACDMQLVQALRSATWSRGCSNFVEIMESGFPAISLYQDGRIKHPPATGLMAGFGYVVAATANTAKVVVANGAGPDKNEPCNKIMVPQDRTAVGQLGFPRYLTQAPGASIYVQITATNVGLEHRPEWTCSHMGLLRSDPLATPPLCRNSRSPLELVTFSIGTLDDNYRPWTVPLDKAYFIVARYFLSDLPARNQIRRLAFETVKLNGQDAIRFVFEYTSSGGRRIGTFVAYAVHGKLVLVGYTFPEAERGSLMLAAHQHLANIRP